MFHIPFFADFFQKLFGKPAEKPAVDQPSEELETIAEIALGNESFETLVAALQATDGLDGLLTTALDPAADITVFAPTDAAFAELAKSLGINVPEVLNKEPADVTDADVALALAQVLGAETVSQVLKYHIKIGGSSLAEIEEAGSIDTLVDVEGLATSFSVSDGELEDADPEVENPEFIAGLTDIPASNGTIQAIDRVLLPLDVMEAVSQPTIAEIASGNENFEILTAALVATNGINGLLDAALSRDADVTVFAPTDDAFIALANTLGIDVSAVLQKDINDVVDADYATALAQVLGAETVSDVLTYHVTAGGDRVSELQEQKVLDTLLNDAILVLDGSEVVDADPQLDNPELIDGLTDIEAANGQIQAIDGVLLPFDLEPQSLRLRGTKEDDVLQGGGADDKLWGKSGNDVLSSGAGNDRSFGGKGDDTFVDGAGNDRSFGHSGDDIFIDGLGNDRYFGSKGDDKFIDGHGDDRYFGGSGSDEFDFTNLEGDNRIYGLHSHDELVLSSNDFHSAHDAIEAIQWVRGGGILDIEDGGSIFLVGTYTVSEDQFQIA